MNTTLEKKLFASFLQKHPSLRFRVQAYKVELLLFLLLWGTFAYFYQSTQQNEASRFDQTRAIVQEHRLAIDDYWWNSADVIRYTKNNRDYIYPNKAPGTTLLAVPVFFVATNILKPLMWLGLPQWIYWHIVAYLTILFTIGLLSALSAIMIYRVLQSITGDARFSIFAVLAIWFGTMVFPFSTLFFSHQQAGALLAIAFGLLFALRRNPISSRRSVSFLFVAGALMGFSVTTEYPTALLVIILSAYGLWAINRMDILWKAKGKLTAALALGLMAGGGFLLWYNIAAFGKVFYVPYEAYAKAGSSFPIYSHGFLGFHWPGSGQFLNALAAITVKPPIGMLYIGVENWRLYASSPVLWLALPGTAIMLWRRSLRPEGFVVTAMIIGYVFFITSYGNSIYDWSGGAYIGPRHIVPLLPFLALPIYYGGRQFKFVFYPLLAVSVFYMLLATAVEPRVPYPFENPPRDSFLPDYLHGRLAQNTDALFDPEHHKLTVDSTAFNLAKLARVRGSYQLVPLMLWWSIVGSALLFAVAPKLGLVQNDSLTNSLPVGENDSVDEPDLNVDSEKPEGVN